MPFQVPLSDGVTIQALRPVAVRTDGSIAYEGDVVVRYGSTKLTADRVVVYRGEMRGTAEGHVVIVDPDGTAQADRLEFGWNPAHRYGKGENVTIRALTGYLHARRAALEPGRWDLYDVRGTTYLGKPSPYDVSSDHVILTPGQNAVVHEPHVSLLGKFIAKIPTQFINLNPGVAGLHYPAPQYKLRRGFGFNWTGGILAGHNGTFTYNAHSYENSKPSAFALYTRSFIPIDRVRDIVAPQTDFAERFAYGFLDSVVVVAPENETRYLRSNRFSFSAGGQLNGSVIDRERGTRYSKIESVLQRGGSAAGFGLLGQVRVQAIQREDGELKPRAILAETVSVPTFRLAPRLTTIARFDAQGFGGSTLYGWVRGMAGVSYAPSNWLRLTAAGFASGQAGTPEFEIDPLYSKGGTLARADFLLGNLRISALSKDDKLRGRYDNEFIVTQGIGFLQAYYLYREYPPRRQIGVTLRVQPFLDLYKRRSAEEKAKKGSETP